MQSNAEDEKKWRFAQCFGDKGDSDDITEGNNNNNKCNLPQICIN
jgi:hypothetical protein